jgi:hypothetical protein
LLLLIKLILIKIPSKGSPRTAILHPLLYRPAKSKNP